MAAPSPVDMPLYLEGPADACRVVVAMSGGVDSSVVAALLRRRGYDVVGITLQLYDHGEAVRQPGACCAGQDIKDARRIAEKLQIPHYVLDYEARFQSSVIAEFADSYLAGETPVPCVTCNQQVKFRDLLVMARDLGAAALATGHYVESRPGANGFELYRAADASRDQSYFLFGTTRAQLAFLRFPLGSLTKAEVRAAARELGLPVADKRDSQDICFVPKGRYADVIERLRPGASEPGDIVDANGHVLGRHEGIMRYTIGQRRGLGIASGEPLFVVRIDAARHQVVVGPREALKVHRMRLDRVNWLGDGSLAQDTDGGLPVHVRVRSSGEPRPALLETTEDGTSVTLIGGDYGVSPGQACVFYADDHSRSRVLGGGTISATLDARPTLAEPRAVAVAG